MAGFTAAADAVVLDVACVDVVLEPPTVARVHRLLGLRWFVARKDEAAAQAFAAARRADPTLRLEGLPEGHVALELFERFDPRTLRDTPVAPARTGALWFDGRKGPSRPEDVPTVMQRVDKDGVARVTAYVAPDEPLPDYEARALPRETTQATRCRAQVAGWWAATGVAAVASGVLAGLSVGAEANFYEAQPTWTEEDFARQRGRTNGLVIGSATAGGVALGLSAVALTVTLK